MRALIIALVFVSFNAFAIPCDCEVWIFSPITGSQKLPPNVLKSYQLEEYASRSVKNQRECRNSCLTAFEEDLTPDRLTALLLTYSERLIEKGVLGYNCTGLTNLRYPVRTKAILGGMGLGNVTNFIHVVNHEETCF